MMPSLSIRTPSPICGVALALTPHPFPDLGVAAGVDADQFTEPDEARQAGDTEMRRRDLGDRAADACQGSALLKLQQRPLKLPKSVQGNRPTSLRAGRSLFAGFAQRPDCVLERALSALDHRIGAVEGARGRDQLRQFHHRIGARALDIALL